MAYKVNYQRISVRNTLQIKDVRNDLEIRLIEAVPSSPRTPTLFAVIENGLEREISMKYYDKPLSFSGDLELNLIKDRRSKNVAKIRIGTTGTYEISKTTN